MPVANHHSGACFYMINTGTKARELGGENNDSACVAKEVMTQEAKSLVIKVCRADLHVYHPGWLALHSGDNSYST